MIETLRSWIQFFRSIFAVPQPSKMAGYELREEPGEAMIVEIRLRIGDDLRIYYGLTAGAESLQWFEGEATGGAVRISNRWLEGRLNEAARQIRAGEEPEWEQR